MRTAGWCAAAAAATAAVAAAAAYPRLPHVLSRRSDAARRRHAYDVLRPIWSDDEVAGLRDVLRESRLRQTTAAYTPAHWEHIGEREEALPGGGCRSPLLTPNHAGTHCIFPERLDVASHQALSGGIDARREALSAAVPRLIVMQRYFHASENGTDLPAVSRLFSSERYLERARALCPARPVLDPMMLALIVTLPGQMVAMHYDLPWFFGATRYDFPGWLLVVMQASGLFEPLRVPQVQGVAYLHDWADAARRGGFFLYANGTAEPPEVVPARHNTGIICDGTTMVHGTQTYIPDAPPPPVTKDALHELRYAGDGEWELLRDGERIRTVAEGDLRVTLVWRQHCFRDAAERDRLRTEPRLGLDDVLHRLTAELVRRGAVSDPPTDPFALATLLIRHYVAYPYAPAAFPYNLCAVEAVAPRALRPLFRALC